MKHVVFVAPGHSIRLKGGQTLNAGMNRGVSDAALVQLRRGHSGNFCSVPEGPDAAYDAALPPRSNAQAKQAITRAVLSILARGRVQTAKPAEPLDLGRIFGAPLKAASVHDPRDPIGYLNDAARHASGKPATRSAVFDVSKVFGWMR